MFVNFKFFLQETNGNSKLIAENGDNIKIVAEVTSDSGRKLTNENQHKELKKVSHEGNYNESISSHVSMRNCRNLFF